jgi:hypothetical protein
MTVIVGDLPLLLPRLECPGVFMSAGVPGGPHRPLAFRAHVLAVRPCDVTLADRVAAP